MARFARVSLLLVGMGLLLGTVAFANVPDPVNSVAKLRFNNLFVITEPVRIVNVPQNPTTGNRCEIEVTVKDQAGNLINNSVVWVIFSKGATDTLCWCTTQNQTTTVLGDGRREFHVTTNVSGIALFQIGAGGCWDAAGEVTIVAGAPGTTDPTLGIQLRTFGSIASFDNVGAGAALCDGAVSTADFTRYGAAQLGGAGAYNTCFDYNADGVVSTGDFGLYGVHQLRSANCAHTGPKQ